MTSFKGKKNYALFLIKPLKHPTIASIDSELQVDTNSGRYSNSKVQ